MTQRSILRGLHPFALGLAVALWASPGLAQSSPPLVPSDDWSSFKQQPATANPPATNPPATAAPATPPANAPSAPSSQPAPASTPAATSAAAPPAPSSSTPAAGTSPNATSTGPANAAAPLVAPPPPPPPSSAAAPSGTAAAANASGATASDGGDILISSHESFTPNADEHSPGTASLGLADIHDERDAANLNGTVGLLTLDSAHLGHRGVLHLSLTGEYFNSSDFPTLAAHDTRSAATFAAGYNFLEWLEAYGSYNVAANSNSDSAPTLIQDQGDAALGIVFAGQVAKGLDLGLDLRGLLFPGVGNQSVSNDALGFYPRALVTYDPRAVNPSIPLRLHLNLGFILDQTSSLAGSHVLTAAEEFALDVNKWNRFAVAVGIEAPFPVVTGFVEYNLAVPLGASDLQAPDLSSVSVGQVMAQTLGLGLRVTALQDITFNAAFNIGLAQTVAFGIPATMPWNFIFGVAYNVDPFAAGHTKVVEKTYQHPVVQEAASTTGKVEGFVLDANSGKPIPGALVSFADQDSPPVGSDASRGHFLSYDLPVGTATLTAARDGYHSGTATAAVEAGKVATVEVKLVPELKPATLRISLTSHGAPVTGTVQITGDATLTVTAVGVGSTPIPAGNYALSATADGYQPQSQQVSLAAGDDRTVSFEMVAVGGASKNQGAIKKASKPLVVIIKNRIVIRQQVHFAKNKAVILKDSDTLLDQVAEAIKSNNLKKVEVGGHTDNQGDKDANLKLSQDRATAVESYLVKSGIEADRLSAKGYGDTKPIAPNMTAKGRELNRRVEFNILEK